MQHTKAALKATRERVGMTQQDLADALGVQARSVKRWESPASGYEAPQDAWDVLEEALEAHWEAVDSALEIVAQQAEGLGHMPDAVALTYYRDQAQYDALGRDEGLVGVVNARSRAIADALEADEVEAVWLYPDEGSVRTPGSRY